MKPITVPTGKELTAAKTGRKVLLLCGVFSSLFYIAFDVVAMCRYEGYSYTDQNYSELLATGAPTRFLMLLAGIAYNLLVAAFAVGVWTSAAPKRTARITGAVMVGYAVLSMVTPLFFQMDMRGAEATPRGSLHGPMTAVMSMFILLSMGFGAFLRGRQFRFYSFATIVVVIVFGVLTSLQIPRLEAGQPTPWMGLTERINIYATMLWFAVLAIGLLRAQGETDIQGRERKIVNGFPFLSVSAWRRSHEADQADENRTRDCDSENRRRRQAEKREDYKD